MSSPVSLWWMQSDSRMNSQTPSLSSSRKTTPVFPQTLSRKSDCLGLESSGGCHSEEGKGECSLDAKDRRLRWYMAEETSFKDCMLETDSSKAILPTKYASPDFANPLSQRISQSCFKKKTTNGCADKKLYLLKALHLSQTRARSAERKANLITMENESLLNLYFKGSARLFAYAQWVKLLELEIWQLHSQVDLSQSNDILRCRENSAELKVEQEKNQITDDAKRTWYWVVSLCLSFMSVGILLAQSGRWKSGGLCSDNLPRFKMPVSLFQFVRC